MDADPGLLAYYQGGLEVDRLVVDGIERLEMLRTKQVLERTLPLGSLDVLDVGGGGGHYSSWLSSLGHRVTLVDPVPIHVEAAASRAAKGPWFTSAMGDARSLDLPDGTFDAVLLLGPLYHLVDKEDRIRALAEAMRVLRPGGILAAAAVSRFASAFDGIGKGFARDQGYRDRVLDTLATGTHLNPDDEPGQFMTTCWHRPDELRAELEAAGFVMNDLVGVEGPGGYLADSTDAWEGDAAYRAGMVALAAAVEHEPSVLGFGPHLLATATRPSP